MTAPEPDGEVVAFEPPHPGKAPDQDDPRFERWRSSFERWRVFQEKKRKQERQRKRAEAPHSNWLNRRDRCVIHEVRFMKPASIHHGRWETTAYPCGRPCVAYDVTDPRAVGYMYGVCERHMEAAVAADPSRQWWWADARPVDPDTFTEELILLVLAGR